MKAARQDDPRQQIILTQLSLFVQPIAQQFAGFKEGNLLVFDFDGFASARVAAHAGITGLDREGTKAAQFDPITLGERVDDFFEHSVDDTFNVALR